MRKIMKVSLLLSLVLGLYFPTVFAQSNMTNEMFDLAKLKSGVKNKRISSTDPTEATETIWNLSSRVKSGLSRTSRGQEPSTISG